MIDRVIRIFQFVGVGKQSNVFICCGNIPRSFMYNVPSLVCELQCWKEVLITEDKSDIVK